MPGRPGPSRAEAAASAAEPLPAVTYERTPGAASAPLPPGYRRREPQNTALYRIVQQNLETFLAEPQLHGAAGYPAFIERELRRYLDCGILSRGLVRIRCGDCGREKVVAMSCKSRSLCPSCVGRRMTDTASQLRDRLLPKAPYRQWVLSFPYTLRIHLARDQAFFSEMLRGFVRTIFCWHRPPSLRHAWTPKQTLTLTSIASFWSPWFHLRL